MNVKNFILSLIMVFVITLFLVSCTAQKTGRAYPSPYPTYSPSPSPPGSPPPSPIPSPSPPGSPSPSPTSSPSPTPSRPKCDEMYGEKKVPCPKDSTEDYDCCPPENQCCDAPEAGEPTCCQKPPKQQCAVIKVGVWRIAKYYNVCDDLECPDKTWRRCGDPKKKYGKSTCCRKEEHCTAEDRSRNRCGNRCTSVFGAMICVTVGECPPGTEPHTGSYGTRVCCKTDGTEKKITVKGVAKCLTDTDKCKEGQTPCPGIGGYKDKENRCCDPGTTCGYDIDGYPRCIGSDGSVDPYPWPKKSPSPAPTVSPSPKPS